jgi:phosphotransferase system IIB component
MLNIKFHENRLVGAELFHVEVRTDMTKLKVAFSNFAKVPNKPRHKNTTGQSLTM